MSKISLSTAEINKVCKNALYESGYIVNGEITSVLLTNGKDVIEMDGGCLSIHIFYECNKSALDIRSFLQ